MPQAECEAVVCAPSFSLGVCCTHDEITAIHFLAPTKEKKSKMPLAMDAAQQLKFYLKKPDFIFKLPLKPSGTPFQQRVWTEIAAIPLGQTSTYGQLAKNLSNAPRAVGQACGANPFPVIVPCHRVIASDGSLGGFSRQGEGFLLSIKHWLLQHEACLPR